MAGAEQFDCRIQELQHLVAALNALGMVLNVAPVQVCAGQVDGIQKFLDGSAVFDLELGPHMLDGNLQAPNHIAVFFQQFPGIMVQRVLCDIFFNKFLHGKTSCSILHRGRECKFKSGDLLVPAQNSKAETQQGLLSRAGK